jgi:hypothetical protein
MKRSQTENLITNNWNVQETPNSSYDVSTKNSTFNRLNCQKSSQQNRNQYSNDFLMSRSNLGKIKSISDRKVVDFINKQSLQSSCDNLLDETQIKNRRYSLHFLIVRSDVPNSKMFPKNWKHLNTLYPTVCFYGKVLFLLIS